MKDDIRQLIALQEVELDIFRAEQGLAGIPEKLAELDSIMAAREAALNTIEASLAELDGRKALLEEELNENQIILTAADARIKKIKTNKEYLALQREIDLAKKRKADIEEQLLTIMDKIEKKISEKERIEKSFEADRVILDEKKEKLLAQMKELEDVVGEYKGRDEKLRKDVDQSLLSKYDRIRQSKKGLAVVECIDGVCKGCHMHIPPQLFNELVRGDKLIICPTCQRMLYIPAKGQGGEE